VTVVFFPDLDGSLAAAQTATLRRIRVEDDTIQMPKPTAAGDTRSSVGDVRR
jgi:hypothetical protein